MTRETTSVLVEFDCEEISITLEASTFLLCIFSGAPAGAEGARGRSTIAIEIGNPSSRENLDVTSVRPSVRPYARIRAGDEFVFVLDLESFSGKQ